MREDKEFTQFWHNNAIGMWERWIPSDVKTALEIGSFEGASAIWLLDNRPDIIVTCIDVFGQTFDDVTGTYEERFDRNLAEYGDRATKLKGYSGDILPTLEKESYDLIYIDGDHSFEGAYADAIGSFPLLKVGGVVIFDDYNNVEFGVKKAVKKFLSFHRGDFEILRQRGDYQMGLRRIR